MSTTTKAKDMAIGDVRDYDGATYRCVVTEDVSAGVCDSCDVQQACRRSNARRIESVLGECVGKLRQDETAIHFEAVESCSDRLTLIDPEKGALEYVGKTGMRITPTVINMDGEDVSEQFEARVNPETRQIEVCRVNGSSTASVKIIKLSIEI